MKFSRYGSRRRRASYGGYGGRRRWPRVLLYVVAAALIAGLVAGAGWQVVRGWKAIKETDGLKAQIKELSTEVENLEKLVPQAMLNNAAQGVTLDYQKLYPEMKVEPTPVFEENVPNTVYLTFDNGPSDMTGRILDELRDAGQHATFFVVGKNIKGNEAVLKRIVQEGHTIGVHSFTQDYRAVYQSVDTFIEEFHQTWQAIYDACGVYPTVFRFPGGSVNAYNRDVYQQIIAEMLRRGFVYYDWSTSGEDASSKATVDKITQAVVKGVKGAEHPIVLLHDSGDKDETAQAMPYVLSALKDAGYTCSALTNTVRPVTFGYKT